MARVAQQKGKSSMRLPPCFHCALLAFGDKRILRGNPASVNDVPQMAWSPAVPTCGVRIARLRMPQYSTLEAPSDRPCDRSVRLGYCALARSSDWVAITPYPAPGLAMRRMRPRRTTLSCCMPGAIRPALRERMRDCHASCAPPRDGGFSVPNPSENPSEIGA